MPLTLLADRQYTAPSAADSVSITPSGGSWTNSAYVQLLASTPSACVLTGVTVNTLDGNSSSVAYNAEIDIATGAAGAEVVIATVRVVNRRAFSSTGTTNATNHLVLPIPIDNIGAGVRLSARLRKDNTNLTVWFVAVTYLQKPLTSALLLTAGVASVLPPAVGLAVTAGSPAWASGAWVQVRAATGPAVVITGVCFSPVAASTDVELDLGTGGAGSETVITTIRVCSAANGQPAVIMLPTPLDNVAAATRIAVRVRSATASAASAIALMVQERPL